MEAEQGAQTPLPLITNPPLLLHEKTEACHDLATTYPWYPRSYLERFDVMSISAKDSSSDGAEDVGERGGGKASGRPAFNLEFVNMNVVSKAEKQRNQKLIRSTAMRSYRQKQQLQRTKEEEAKSRTTARGIQPRSVSKKDDHSDAHNPLLGSTNAWPSHEIDLSDFSWLMSPSSSSDHSGSDSGTGESPRSDALSSVRLRDFFPDISPVTPLGAGRIDPFRISSVDTSLYIHELIDHSVTTLWPGFRVRGPQGRKCEHPSAWLAKTYERPVVMHAMIFGAAVHMDVLRRPRINLDNPIRLFHKVETMKLLKEELRRPDKMPLDDVILAVLALGTNEVETMTNNMVYHARSPFNSPLSSAQWLDIYGSMSGVPEHVTAMRSLVGRRGGLENIELDGLAEILSLSDILGSTQHMSKPYWPLLRRTISTERTHIISSGNLGKGFQPLVSFGINNNAANVLHSMAELTVIIDSHCRGIRLIEDLNMFIEQRNAIQHSLMSLLTGDELEDGEITSVCLYESIRHAAIIYSVAVTFPLPPISGIFRKLAGRLKDVMEKAKFDPCWQLCPKTLLWMLVLGGIAASETADRIWYVRNLAALSSALRFAEWKDIAEEVENFLWLESACDAGGRSLWNEVMTERLMDESDIAASSPDC